MQFKKSSKIRHFHFHGVSHKHLIFKNSSQEFLNIIFGDIIFKIVGKKAILVLLSCETCPKGKHLTLNPRQEHMKITYHIYCGCFFFSLD